MNLLIKKVYGSALTMPAITQCKPNENLKSWNGKLKKNLPHIIDFVTFCLIPKELATASLQNSAIGSTHRNISIFQQ